MNVSRMLWAFWAVAASYHLGSAWNAERKGDYARATYHSLWAISFACAGGLTWIGVFP